MDAAIRVLREELHWLELARDRAAADVANPRVPTDLVRAQLAALSREISEIEEALECLTCDVSEPFQPALPFEAQHQLLLAHS